MKVVIDCLVELGELVEFFVLLLLMKLIEILDQNELLNYIIAQQSVLNRTRQKICQLNWVE